MKKIYILLIALFVSTSSFAQLIINEVHYDPAAGIAGDANGDGVRDSGDDEFIEFVNNSETPLDISGYQIFDLSGLRHVVPAATILPANGVYVVFGGGTPTGITGNFVHTASVGFLALNNTGEVITVKDASDTTLITFDGDAIVPTDENESITRSPDITGNFVKHTTANAGLAYSPGTNADGSLIYVLSTKENQIDGFDLYPNPSSEAFVNISSDKHTPMKVSVFDILGKQVIQRTITNNRINISNLNTGVYILRAEQDNAFTTRKLIIN